MDFLYRIVLILAWPLVLLYFAIRVARQPEYFRTLPERFGFLPRTIQQTASGAIWLHAVSVGEILAAVELIRHLRKMLPEAAIFVSTTTLAGRRLADQKLLSLVDGIFFTPLDFPFAVRKALRRLKPTAVVVMETEIWPTLYREAKRAGCGLILVNARISDKALPSYRKYRWFFRRTLALPDRILAQSPEMKIRYLDAGAPEAAIHVSGNLKYDFRPPPPSEPVLRLVESLRPCQVWIAASTMPPDEDDTVIRAFQELSKEHRRLLLILAPRKPERFQMVAGTLAACGIRTVRRTELPAMLDLPGVLLMDTIGELAGLFPLADVVFVGGSIVTWGGHNVLEPAIFSKPIVVGPYMMNFREMAEEFKQNQAYLEVPDADSLAPAVDRLLKDANFASSLGERARQCAEAQSGATATAATAIREIYDAAVPQYRPALDWLLWPLARIWELGVRIDRWRATPRKLGAPVISVGNLSVGGTSKTPAVLRLASHWPEPAILTRGYGRKSNQTIAVGPGVKATLEETGDEAQAYLSQRRAWVGIGANRIEAAARIPIKPAIFLLDDGFQHWPIARDLDIVLIDALDPSGGGDVIPRGRLREPPSALSRAGILIVTRTRRPRPGIEKWLRFCNPSAPIFYGWLEPLRWIHGPSGEPADLPAGNPAAVCGLGNPESFWQSLRELGVSPARRNAFPDHHHYTQFEIEQTLQDVPFAVTTKKDWVKLQKFGFIHIYWLEVSFRLDREEEFWALVDSHLNVVNTSEPC